AASPTRSASSPRISCACSFDTPEPTKEEIHVRHSARHPRGPASGEAPHHLPHLRLPLAGRRLHADQRSRSFPAPAPVRGDASRPVRLELPRERPDRVAGADREEPLMGLSLSTSAAPELEL